MPIKLYWWRGAGASDSTQQNFGDYLSPLIVEMVSGKKVVHAEPRDADMIAIGSILAKERKARGWLWKRKLHIWGSGTDKASRAFSAHHFYHAVRGNITRSQIKGQPQNPALGDPGLLVDQLYKGGGNIEKKYGLGVIPHFVDQQDPRVQEILSLPHTRLINVFSPVEQVVREIRQCNFVLSSSMHGLIVADSFGIPNRRMPFSSGIISDLKFDDYYSAFGLSCPASVTPEEVIEDGWEQARFFEDYQRPGLDALKEGLYSAFPLL